MTPLLERTSQVALSERELRRQIDRSVARALVDPDFARHLLADPTVALDNHGCTPQQYLELRSITAGSITDFARQAVNLFWANDGYPRRQSEQVQRASAAR